MNLPDVIKRKLRELPDAPGCYLMRDEQGRIVYVGKASSLRRRVTSYFRDAALRRGGPKLRALVHSVRDFDVVVVRSDAEAILTEGRLIKEYKPRYNVSFRDDKRFLMLSANPRDALPTFRFCRIRRDDGHLYFGPYASAQAPRAALDFVEKRFGIRKCRPRIPDAETYRHCLNDIIRHCMAPCVGKATPEQYRSRFEEACAFLRGERPGDLRRIEEDMRAAAAALDFERAAGLRDLLLRLRQAVQSRVRMTSAPELRREDAAAGLRELQAALELPHPPRIIEGFDVSTISGTLGVASLICFEDGQPQRSRYRRFRIRTVAGANDLAMLGEAVRRRYERLQAEGRPLPDLVLVDGGAGQVASARAALDAAGLPDVPLAGLAKRFEEIHRPGGGAPLHLPRDSRALQVLQHLRDEAHRFALTYHRLLRARRIQESRLDEVSGVGPALKRRLLERFGSVQRLARASDEDLAAVPGIGDRLVAAIRQGLAEGNDRPGKTTA
jgi:excinuclease ABC subunit C